MTKTTIGDVYYASGSNHAGEIAGLADLGKAIGVTVDKLNDEALAQLEADADRVEHLFVDSGAFGEVKFTKPCPNGTLTKSGRPKQVPCAPYTPEGKEITDADWRERLATYQRIANLYGSKAVVVAPDKIADQATTLARMSRYRKAVQAIAATGCGILVPVQGGEHSMVEFFKRACWALGMTPDQVIPAVPSKKGATPPAKVVEFVKAARPARVHLLGMGETNDKAPELVAQLEALGAAVTLDSCLITASVGKSNGRDNHPAEFKGQPRILTACNNYQPEGLTVAERKRRSVKSAFSGDSSRENAAYMNAVILAKQAEQIASMKAAGNLALAARLEQRMKLYQAHTRRVVEIVEEYDQAQREREAA